MPVRFASPRLGFTLVELMVAVAVLTLLVAIALPAYNEQVSRSRRTAVQTELMEDANYLQRYYSANSTYSTATPANLPASQSPRMGAASYTITIASQSASGFQLQAIRAGNMSADRCGDFTYDNLGAKGVVHGVDSVGNCWR